MGVEDARSPSRMRGWARAILSGYPGRFQCVASAVGELYLL